MGVCNHCEGTGFLNLRQVAPEIIYIDAEGGREAVLEWIKAHDGHDVQVCNCCGDGEGWYGEPGEHYGVNDPSGPDGPYAYNGGLCECH